MLDTDDALHSEIIGVAYLHLGPPAPLVTFPHTGPAEADMRAACLGNAIAATEPC